MDSNLQDQLAEIEHAYQVEVNNNQRAIERHKQAIMELENENKSAFEEAQQKKLTVLFGDKRTIKVNEAILLQHHHEGIELGDYLTLDMLLPFYKSVVAIKPNTDLFLVCAIDTALEALQEQAE